MNYLKSIKKVFDRVVPFVLLLAVLGFSIASVSAQPTKSTKEPAVEWLKFQVPAQLETQSNFIRVKISFTSKYS